MADKNKNQFGNVKSGSSSRSHPAPPAPVIKPPKKIPLGKPTDEDIFEMQSPLRKLVDTASKAKGKQVR